MRSSPLLVAIAAVAIVAGCVSESLPPPSQPSNPSTPIASSSASPASLGTTASTEPSASPIPSLSVADAVAVRDGGVDRREIEVSGFLSPFPRLPCALILAGRNPARLDCPFTFQWLMAEPERLMQVGQGSVDNRRPSGPAFHPSFALVDAPDVPIPPAGGPVDPVPVDLIGHFDDRRAALCPTDPEPAVPCADAFVVDQVASVGGRPIGVTTSEELDARDGSGRKQPISMVDDVDAAVRAIDPDAMILSRRVLTGDRVVDVEPSLAGAAEPTIVWSVVFVDRSSAAPVIARTFLIPDGGGPFTEMTLEGRVPVAQPAPS